ncbi:MAG TPA: M20 family metallopeptidase [Anaerolineae bacterium]|nr:M20 family metallopeptidase [Anaerolineae bacterium]
MRDIETYLLDRRAEMEGMLERLVMLESPTFDREAVNGVGGALAEAFGALGAKVERLPQAGYGDHVRVTWGEGSRQILLMGHMDTVWPIGETRQRPFKTASHGTGAPRTATGPGCFDMKGGLVIGLFAAAALKDLHLSPAHRLVFLFNSDEEVGSPTSRQAIETEGRRSDYSLVLEPSREDALVTWRKGVGRFELEITGVASHSGAAHERGVSAVQELAHQVLRLEGMTDYGHGTTVNVGIVRGGSRVNIRPESAYANIDLRVLTPEEGERMTEAIRGLSPVDPRTTLEVKGGLNRPPWAPTPAGEALFRRARRVGSELGLDLHPAGTGGGSDGNFTAALGVPTLDGLGPVGEDAHALTEWVDLDSLPRRAALLAGLLLELGR